MSPSARRVWGAPVLLGVLTLVGLLSALLGDGVWDALSALALGSVVATGAWHSLKRPSKLHRPRR